MYGSDTRKIMLVMLYDRYHTAHDMAYSSKPDSRWSTVSIGI